MTCPRSRNNSARNAAGLTRRSFSKPLRGGDPGEFFEDAGNPFGFRFLEIGSFEQGGGVIAEGEVGGLADQRVAIALNDSMEMGRARECREETEIREIVSGGGNQGRKVQQGGEQDHAVEAHAVAGLQVFGKSCHADASVGFS